MRQERLRRPDSPKTQHTADSWDFGSTTTSPKTLGPTFNSPKILQKTKSITSERNHEDRPETRCRSPDDKSEETPLQTTMEPSVAAPSSRSEALSPPHPIPMARRDGSFAHRDSPSSSYSLAAAPPNLSYPSTSPSLWNKLTRRSSRNTLVDEESPKGNSISRFLGRRGSSSLAQRPNILPV